MRNHGARSRGATITLGASGWVWQGGVTVDPTATDSATDIYIFHEELA